MSECLVLYTFQFDRTGTYRLFSTVCEYFSKFHDIHFRFGGFYNETYDIKYGTLKSIVPLLLKENPEKIVEFSLDSDDLRKKERSVGVEFNFTRPIRLTIFFPKSFGFDINLFLGEIEAHFDIQYGFLYLTSESYYITAYALGDFSHRKGLEDVGKISKIDYERWLKFCEKITLGHVRGIYEFNILTGRHVERLFEGLTFKELIVEKELGSIEKVGSDIFLWKLDKNERSLAQSYFETRNFII